MVRLIAAHIAMLDLLAILLAAHIDVLDLSQSFWVNARIVPSISCEWLAYL
jgi:hypothetical protein